MIESLFNENNEFLIITIGTFIVHELVLIHLWQKKRFSF